ncbi:YcgN family cysteine cluster protein [Treponema sp.]|uniref:YcgN family cysteine cluster protein n=1 Tax=Treponema sp. TaxID=166 RepID=UPI0025DEA545|nr:YcgN family cysteine cluster protein [Treponema sp.]MCR5217389.1 YcgN family cysteine cluster protein [Treponema sp.]
MIESDFYKVKSLTQMNEEEWEALCDGCGKCCLRKYITGYGKKEKLHFTRIACNLLNLKNGQCSNYCHRFELNEECIRLTKDNLPEFKWLPSTCAYRLIYEGKDLPPEHPLVSGKKDSVKTLQVKNLVHEEDIDEAFWEDYEIEEC